MYNVGMPDQKRGPGSAHAGGSDCSLIRSLAREALGGGDGKRGKIIGRSGCSSRHATPALDSKQCAVSEIHACTEKRREKEENPTATCPQ